MGDLKGSIMGFFGIKSRKEPLATYKRHPDEYFSQTWLNRRSTVGMKLIMEVDRKTKKALTQEWIDGSRPRGRCQTEAYQVLRRHAPSGT